MQKTRCEHLPENNFQVIENTQKKIVVNAYFYIYV